MKIGFCLLFHSVSIRAVNRAWNRLPSPRKNPKRIVEEFQNDRFTTISTN